MRLTAFLLLMLSFSLALNLISPLNEQIKNNSVYYVGHIGPGQAISFVMEREVKTGGKFGTGGYYDYAYAFSLPENWSSKPSPLYANPLQVIVKSPSDVREGIYVIGIALVDEKNVEGLGTIKFYAKVNVSYDVMNASVGNVVKEVGEGQPVRYKVVVTNKADVGDIFVVECSAGRNYVYKEFYIPPGSSHTTSIELSFLEEGEHKGIIRVFSKSSPERIKKEIPIKVYVRNSLVSDLFSLEKGVLLFFSHEQLIYSSLNLIAYLIR